MNCPKCGAENYDWSEKCSKCFSNMKSKLEKKEKRKMIIIIAFLILWIVININSLISGKELKLPVIIGCIADTIVIVGCIIELIGLILTSKKRWFVLFLLGIVIHLSLCFYFSVGLIVQFLFLFVPIYVFAVIHSYWKSMKF